MEAPIGPDGVRPCDCTGAGKTTPQSKRRDNHRPARCMARLYRRQEEGTSLRPATALLLEMNAFSLCLEPFFLNHTAPSFYNSPPRPSERNLMLAKVRSVALVGIDAHLIDVEVDIAGGLPQFSVVGLPDATVRESRDRVRSALKNTGLPFPRKENHRESRSRGNQEGRLRIRSWPLPSGFSSRKKSSHPRMSTRPRLCR